MSIPVIAIFDIGKSNKKFFLFDEDYKIVFEKCIRLPETVDEDGFTCEDIQSLKKFIIDSLHEISANKNFELKAINFSTYGASLVYVDKNGEPLTPLYNYLKPYPEYLYHQFYNTYGGEDLIALETASPVLGSLNSGLQLYRLKYEQPEIFKQVKYALHLPQYISYLITGSMYSDITSIGCHTALWDFQKQQYHHWVKKENLFEKLAPVKNADEVCVAEFNGKSFNAGIGLHDSSAALIPYLISIKEPFILLSTGTWSISLNPFDETPLTIDDFKNDCLNYLQYKGKPVRASRLFAGYQYEQQIKRLADFFNKQPSYYQTIKFDKKFYNELINTDTDSIINNNFDLRFEHKNLSMFPDDITAYYQLIIDLIAQQHFSTSLVLKNKDVKQIIVDGGFSKNDVYMNLLALAFPHKKVYAASMAQGTALGAAFAIHNAWNLKPIPSNFTELKLYSLLSNRI